jgi:hypothetical protein
MEHAVKLKEIIENLHLDHRKFNEASDLVCNRIEDGLETHTPKVSWFVAPSRWGKSHLIKRIRLRYPEQIVNGRRIVQVLPFKVLPSTSEKSLPESVLKALKVPYQATNVSATTLITKAQINLEMAQARVLVGDEAHHVVEAGSKVIPYDAADWFKNNDSDDRSLVLSQILLGMPRLKKLMDANIQLRMRSYAIATWMPYDPKLDADLKEFVAMVNTYMRAFIAQGWSFSVPLNVIGPNCYLHAAGLGGKLRDFMVELAGQVQRRGPCAIGMEDFRAVASSLESAGHPNYPAFAKELVTPVELNQAYHHVLVSNELV